MILKTFHTIYERVEQVGGGSVVLLAMELQLLDMELVKTMQFDPSQSLRVTFKVLGGKTWLDNELGLTPESPWYGNSFWLPNTLWQELCIDVFLILRMKK